jgi:hypothetical protein
MGIVRLGLSLSIALSAIAPAAAFAAPLYVSITVAATASAEIANPSFTFGRSNGAASLSAALENPIGHASNVHGSIRTSRLGTGSIGVFVPTGSLVGRSGRAVPVERLRMSCAAGDGNLGLRAEPSDLATFVRLTAGAITSCATYNAAHEGTAATLGIALKLYLDGPATDAPYTFSGYSIVAGAT